VSTYTIAQLNDIEEIDDGRCPLRPVRHHLGITSFGINAWTGDETGDRIINEHAEEQPGDNEELYIVMQGRARFELDGEDREAPAGTFVFVPPGVKRTAFAEEPATTIIAVGGTPGKAYQVFGWEVWQPLRPLYEAGEYEKAAEGLREVVAEHPEYPMLAYNLACLESLTGQKAEALEHLRGVVGESEQLRELAKTDTDLDAIRNEPEFEAIVGG